MEIHSTPPILYYGFDMLLSKVIACINIFNDKDQMVESEYYIVLCVVDECKY